MLLSLYKAILNLPNFRGKARSVCLFRTLFFNPEISRVIYRLLMELDPLEWTQITLIKDGCIEPLTTTLYGKILQPGDTYIDVGAHVGFHTLVARHFVGNAGRVIAIEPQPYNCQKIMTNWQANKFDNLLIYMAAAGEQNGTVTLHNQSAIDKARLSLCLKPINDQAQKFQVPLLRLDSIFIEHNFKHVKLLKIEVERYELEVINGLGHYADIIENIILEVLVSDRKLTIFFFTILEILKSFGYKIQTVKGKPWQTNDPIPENNLWATRKHHSFNV